MLDTWARGSCVWVRDIYALRSQRRVEIEGINWGGDEKGDRSGVVGDRISERHTLNYKVKL